MIILNIRSVPDLEPDELSVCLSITMTTLHVYLELLTIQLPATKNSTNAVGASTKHPIS